MTKIKSILLVVFTLLTTNAMFGQKNFGVDYFLLGEYSKAKQYLTKDLSSNPSTNNFYLGEVAFAEKNLTLAGEYYQKGLSADPENLLNQVGLLKLKVKNDENADKELTAIAKKSKKNSDLIIAIGRAYLDNGMIPQAKLQFAAARKANSKDPNIYIFEGDIIIAENDSKRLGEAASKYEQATYFDADYGIGYVKTAQVYEKINSRLAIDKLKALIEKQPDYIVAYGLLGKIYVQNGFYPQGIEMLKTYLASGIYSIDDLSYYIRALYFTDQFEEAKKYVKEGIQKEPEHFVLNRLLMYIDSKTNNIEEGLKVADKFFTFRHDTGYISLDFINYAKLLKDAGKYNECYDMFQKAINLEPANYDLYDEASSAARKNKNYAESAHFLREKMHQKAKEAAADGLDYVDDLVDVNTLGYDFYSAGATIAKNQELAAELMKDISVIQSIRQAIAEVNSDSLSDAAYFTKYYALYNLNKADSVFDVQIKIAPDSYTGYRFKALTKHAINPDTEVGLAKPFYEKVVEILEADKDGLSDSNKRVLLEAYNYLGYYYYMKSDKDNTIKYWTKVLEIDPENTNAKLVLEDVNKKK
jgi:tetratricopeptide (TPR) repeat protein